MAILKFPHSSMKIYQQKKFWISIVVITAIITFFCFYCFHSDFRNFITIYVFRKHVSQNNLVSIPLNEDSDSYVYAYDKYITILNKNTLFSYTSNGNLSSQNDVLITHPLFASNNRFLAIAENNGNSLYLVSRKQSTMADKCRWKNCRHYF